MFWEEDQSLSSCNRKQNTLVRPDRAKGLEQLFILGPTMQLFPLLFCLRTGTACVLEEVWFNFYFTCGTIDKVQK